MFARLDRGCANLAWIDLVPQARLYHLKPFLSDHLPILLNFAPGGWIKRIKNFRFINFWAQ